MRFFHFFVHDVQDVHYSLHPRFGFRTTVTIYLLSRFGLWYKQQRLWSLLFSFISRLLKNEISYIFNLINVFNSVSTQIWSYLLWKVFCHKIVSLFALNEVEIFIKRVHCLPVINYWNCKDVHQLINVS